MTQTQHSTPQEVFSEARETFDSMVETSFILTTKLEEIRPQVFRIPHLKASLIQDMEACANATETALAAYKAAVGHYQYAPLKDVPVVFMLSVASILKEILRNWEPYAQRGLLAMENYQKALEEAGHTESVSLGIEDRSKR